MKEKTTLDLVEAGSQEYSFDSPLLLGELWWESLRNADWEILL